MSKPSHIETIHENIKRQEGQHSLSLDVPEGEPGAVLETDLADILPESFNLDALADTLHLDNDETAWFSAVYLDGLSRRDLADRLDWNRQRRDRVRRRLARKLARYRREADRASFDPDRFVVHGSSLRLSYAERLPSGRSCWTLAQVDAGFETIMNGERAELFGDKQRLLAKAKSIAA